MAGKVVSEREFKMLAAEVKANGERLERIDQGGTRGIGSLSVQMAEVIKDVADARAEVREFRADHDSLHKAEANARVVARRWYVGTLIALLVAIEGPLAYLLAHVR